MAIHFRHSVIRISYSSGGWIRTNIETFKASHPALGRPRRKLKIKHQTTNLNQITRRNEKNRCWLLAIGFPLSAFHFRQGCGGRNRTRVWAINSRLPVPALAPPQCVVVALQPRKVFQTRQTKNPVPAGDTGFAKWSPKNPEVTNVARADTTYCLHFARCNCCPAVDLGVRVRSDGNS